MDTNEASRHTQSIMSRVNQQRELDKLVSRTVEIASKRAPEDSAEETLGESDMDTTVLDMDRISEKLPSNFGRNLEVGGIDEDLGRSLVRTLRYGTPLPTLGISPTMTKLTFGLSRSLEDMSLGSTHGPLEN